MVERAREEAPLPPGTKEKESIKLAQLASEHAPLRQWLIGIVKDQTEQYDWRMRALTELVEMSDDGAAIGVMEELLDWLDKAHPTGRLDVLARHDIAHSITFRALTVKEPGEACLRIVKRSFGDDWPKVLVSIAENPPPSNPGMDTREEKAIRDAKARCARALLEKFPESAEGQ